MAIGVCTFANLFPLVLTLVCTLVYTTKAVTYKPPLLKTEVITY